MGKQKLTGKQIFDNYRELTIKNFKIQYADYLEFAPFEVNTLSDVENLDEFYLEMYHDVLFDIKHFAKFLENLETSEEKLSLLYKIKAASEMFPTEYESYLEKRQKFSRNLEIYIEENKTLLSFDQQTTPVKRRKQDDEMSFRRKVYILMLLTFGQLDKHPGIIQERYVEFFQSMIGGDVSDIRKIMKNAACLEVNKQSAKAICNDLNIILNQFRQLGFTENVDRIRNELEFIIEYFEKGENYFLPHLLEEKKKFSWAKMTESILELAQSA